ncbi:MAG TPA: tetratricopeptide repeat protein [Candidatus Saccharicenans sp.]|nr:tetratricopeptide repeat protein [Candidatus Saccharicenans sp.]HRD01099.1 tetratricopeptide repeat protein [Candidatus Saccharicenans sp.]
MKKYYHLFLLIVFFSVLAAQAYVQGQSSEESLGKYANGVVTVLAWDNNKNRVGEGCGLALADNLIAIPYHFVSQATEAEITSSSGKSSRVEALVAVDHQYDLALVRLKGKLDVKPLPLGRSDQLSAGAPLAALAEVSGQIIITSGEMRGWLELIKDRVKLMAISMSLEKPTSGAPIFNNENEVAGLALVLESGIKFGVPVESLLALTRSDRGLDLKSARKEIYFETSEGSYLAGKAACLLNEPAAAIRYFEKYVKLKPDDGEAYLCLGRCYYQLSDFANSYNSYSRALQIKPDDAQGLYGLGLNLLRQKNFKEAAELLEKALTHGLESNEAFFELGSAYEELQSYGQAASYYLKYVQSGPERPWNGWFKLAQTYQKNNEIGKAIDAYRQALKLRPEDINSNYNLALLLAANQQYAEAEQAYKKLIELNPRDAVFYYNQIIQMYDQAGQYENALESVKKIIELNPKSEVAVYNLGIMYFKLNRLEEAAKTINDCLALKNDYTSAWYNLGLVYGKMNRRQEAAEAFKKYTELAPEDASGWLNCGLEYMLLKKFEQALPYVEQSVKLKPDDPMAQYNLAIIYINLNDNYSAREVLKVLQRLDRNLADRLSRLIK